MHILIISPYYKPAYIYGGPIVSISRLAEQLDKQSYKITIWTTLANGDNLLDIEANIEHKKEDLSICYFNLVGRTDFFFSPRLLMALYKKVPSFDVVHIHTWWNLTAILASFICLLNGVKPLLSPRGMLSPYSFINKKSSFKQIFHFFLGKRLLRNTILHATAIQEFDECRAILPEWKGFIAPNIVTLKKIDIPVRFSQNDVFDIIFLSRIHHKKGIELFLESLSKVAFDWQFSIAGKGDDLYVQTLKDLTIELKINQNIHWINWADEDKKFELLAKADLMVLPSFNENFANTVLESLSVGTAVLVSNQVGLSDYVEKNDFGWITTLDSDSMTIALNQAYQQKEKRVRIRTLAPAQISKDFEPSTVANQYIAIYQKIINKEF